MEIQEITALNDLRKGLLAINGAISRLGKDKNEMVIILPNDDFVYFRNVLSSGVSSFSNYYISISDDTFTLSGIKISRQSKEI
ncbi:MAG: hypothetical protein RR959_06000 [Erysipelotrichaceae bacterium]